MGENKLLTIIIWDVQHGSAAYLKTPNNKHIVIDLGSGTSKNKKFSPLLYLKESYNISTLDKVIITHPHTDHIDDIGNFDELDPKALQRPKHLKEEDIRSANQEKDSAKTDKYLEINKRYNTTITGDEDINLPENSGGVTFYNFISTKCDTSNINNHSIVTIAEYLGLKVLIPGDNQTESWKELLENNDFVAAIKGIDIFIASHHGRDNGYYKELFDHFTPKLVIISDGPETTTNASSKYSNLASGWQVYKRSGAEPEKRYCVTTRKDGCIEIKIGKNQDSGKFIQVTVD